MSEGLDRRMAETIEHLSARWHQPQKEVLRRVFPLLARGRPLSVAEIARELGFAEDTLEEALRFARADRDVRDRVTELYGFTLTPTYHRVCINDVTMFSCCAAVAHMLPNLVGHTVRVESVDPTSRRIISLTISESGVESIFPEQAVSTLASTDQETILENVSAGFCSHVFHFASAESARSFVSEDSRRYLVNVPRLNAFAQRLCRAVWPGS